MKDPKIKVYELGNNKKKYRVINKDHPLLDEIGVSENMFPGNDNGSQTVLNSYLGTNPFLYNSKTANVAVNSIEDFYIQDKSEKIALGDVIRNQRYSPRKRVKLIKKAFSNWKKDYISKKNQTFKENDKVVEVIGDISYLEYTWKAKLLLFIIFILLLFLVVTESIIWNGIKQGPIGYFFYRSIVGMYEKMGWLKIIGNIGIYLSLILIFYSSLYSYIIKDFRKNYKLAQSFLNNSESSISRQFNKKYNRAKRYYLKRINNKKYPFFPPLNIEEVEEGTMNITIFNDICRATIDRAYIVKKTKPLIQTINTILKFLGLACVIVIVGMSLYSIVFNMFT